MSVKIGVSFLTRLLTMKYHITTIENANKILKEGLIASITKNSELSEKGYIYLFDNKSFIHPLSGIRVDVADDIAKNQLLMSSGDSYAMLEIDEQGFKNELELDKVGELSSLLGCLWKVKQDRINKKYINFFGVYELP